MLNYFLSFLAGKERRQLKVKDPKKYGFDPKSLLSQIVTVYLHLGDADPENAFATAIARDGRCYSDVLFMDTANILRGLGHPDHDVNRFESLAERSVTH